MHSTVQGHRGWSRDDRTGIVRWPRDHITINNWGTRIGRWSSGHPQASVQHPGGARLAGITKIPGPPCADRQAAARRPTDEWIFVTSADDLANFNCELKCSGHRPMTWGWALQECLFGRPPHDFCRIWCKTRRTVIGRSIFLYCDVDLSNIRTTRAWNGAPTPVSW